MKMLIIFGQHALKKQKVFTQNHITLEKTKKGLTVECIPYHIATRKHRVVNQVVKEKQIPYLGGYEYECYKDIKHYYCSRCNYELKEPIARYCPCCDSELFEEEDE